ncbi:MAG TPA: diacylglycerol kinase family protein [Parachlamydiaceae bacterium]|nr:diacylglycerol kinase family protein [Parachlamydiaceae bacterium]
MLKRTLLVFSFFVSILSTYAIGVTAEGKKQIVFIVNPISHNIKGFDIQSIVEKNLDTRQFEYKIVYSQYVGHATQLAQDALFNSFDIVAAIGGDGTVNEVGKALINTDLTLAIIPVGSGNGLARHLGIPVGLSQSIQALNHAHTVVIDTAKINDIPFLGVAGIGFDAQIAQQFAVFGKRGLLSYCQVALAEFSDYESQSYFIKIDGKEITRKAFILTFANSSQYGNNFIIAPNAQIDDGYLDLVIIDEVSVYSIPALLYQLKSGRMEYSSYFETHRFKEITISQPLVQAHMDGEPVHFYEQINISVVPHSLKIMVPR